MITGLRYFIYIRKKREDSIQDVDRIWILIGTTFGELELIHI